MEGTLLNKQPYEAPEVQYVNVTTENCILYVSNFDGAETD